MIFDLQSVQSAVVVGAGHGIGAALVQGLLELNTNLKVFATFNNSNKNAPLLKVHASYPNRLRVFHVDPTDEEQVKNFSEEVGEETNQVELLLNSVGFLHSEKISPERSLRDVSLSSLQKYFKVNASPHLILAKEFHSLFRHSRPSAFVAVSAKVGSIEDNSLGGWYGYRASKAALNMFVKGVSLEYSRRGCKSLVLSIHPGTTVTELSEPFIKNTHYKLHTVNETALNILNVIDQKPIEETGGFYSWDGHELPW